MALENLIERTNITFPRPLDANDVKPFLKYILGALPVPSSVEYSISKVNRLSRDEETPLYIRSRTSNFKVNGSVKFGRETADFDLETDYDDNDNQVFTKLKFFTTPGYDIEAIPEERLKIMDAVRQTIKHYFRA